MNVINIAWQKHSSDEVQFISNRQFFQQDSIQRGNNPGRKAISKKVQFNCPTPVVTQQAFENGETNDSEINRRSRSSFDSNGYASSTTNVFTSQLPTIDDRSICSARGVVITFIITVVIIVMVAIAVGVVFSTIKTGHNNAENTNQSSFFTIWTTRSTTAMTSSVSIGNQTGAPCSSYTTIDDPSRNVLHRESYGTCDNGPLFNTSTGGAWIRFVGNGGTVMASASPGINHCGSYLTAWYNGTVPTALGAIVNGSICYTTDVFNCFISFSSSVIYCTGGFYIYFLSPVVPCNTRYCTA